MKYVKLIFFTFVLMSFFILSKVNATTLSISSASYTNNGTSWQNLPYWTADNRYDFNPYLMQAIRLNLNLTGCSSGGQYNFTFYTDPNYSDQSSMIDTTTLNGISCNVSVTHTGNSYVSCPNVPSSSSYQLQFSPYILPQSFTMGIVKEYSFTCGFDSNSIINNNNTNTNNIINNNNENTQDIIDNQNELLGDECANLFDKNNYGTDIQGKLYFNLSNLQIGKIYTISTNNNVYVYKFATTNNNESGSSVGPETWTEGIKSWTFTYQGHPRLFLNTNTRDTNFNTNINQLSNYNFMLVEGNSSKPYCEYGSVKSKLDTTNSAINDNTQAINDVNNSINNNNVSGANQDANNFVNNSAFLDNTGLSSIITAPLTVVNSLTDTCNPIRLNLPYINTNIDIPCIGTFLEQKVGALIQLVKVVINGYICYLIGLDMFKIVKHARDPNDDRIEVLDL